MAMNKKEKSEMKLIKTLLSLRLTEQVLPDINPDNIGDDIVTGYYQNPHNGVVCEACTTSIKHSLCRADKVTSRGSIHLYSTKIRALKAMRNYIEWECAKSLYEIDQMIKLDKNQE